MYWRQEEAHRPAAQPKNGESAEQRDRRAEKHAEGKRPALVERGENQEHEEQREREDHPRGHAQLGLLFLERHAHVVVAHLVRHGFVEGLFERLHRLGRAISGRGAADDLSGAIQVIPHGKLRTGPRFELGERGKRHHAAFRVADIEETGTIEIVAVLAFGLDIDLPLPAEAVEVIDEQSAHIGLDGAVDVGERDALLERLLAIDIEKLLRHAGQERC